ncbi:MAG: CDP-alcohol phosphatidyltransferase family protein [Oscillospiraceae bacterium]|jgi:CDP-diacylglycerol--glycerol-3-phosphate 3-phosphatidyltransferase|nr:CDP-alcohol phosphatidyltransferase family protein [Oscillospiraceae bacterium]
MKFKRQIPNAISIFRLVTCFSLLGITQIPDRPAMRLAFTLVYGLVGLTDVLDGWIARKFHLESAFGAKIDNIADTCVFAVGFISLLFLLRLYPSAPSVLVLALGAALKVFSFALTKVRFGEWNTMHTYTNKALGCVLFASVPVCVWMGEINFWAVVGVVACIALTVAEDTYILLTSETYNVNHKGLLFEKKGK